MFKLLHIDQNFFYRDLIHKLSLVKKFNYYSSKTPEQAFEIMEKESIDIIITSLEFDLLDKESFVRRLIAFKNPQTPVLVLSAYDDLELKTKLFELGITDFITKDKFKDFLNDLIATVQSKDIILQRLQELSIAIIDDNAMHLSIMRDMLEDHQLNNIETYQSSKNFIDSKKHFDIYFVDCVMPEFTGEQVISKIRAHDEYGVIIAMSTLNSHTVATSVLLQGANDFIGKPFSDNILMARLKANARTYHLLQSLKEKNTILEKLATEDALTGLYNHRAILDFLDKEVERAERYQSPLSVFMFDIDHFKKVNDTYGHHVGDEVLKAIGSIWTEQSRKADFTGRYGGEEFLIVLPNTPLEGAKIYAERIRKDIELMSFTKKEIKITISGGVYQYEQGDNSLEMVSRADSKLYEAKKSGRNQIRGGTVPLTTL